MGKEDERERRVKAGKNGKSNGKMKEKEEDGGDWRVGKEKAGKGRRKQ